MNASSTANVCAVVVTYNRRELLEECLDRISAQTHPPTHVLVIDNASTDGTGPMLAAREGIEVLSLPSNVGSAGGFAEGIRMALEHHSDWLWLLDDDTFPETSCLETLLDGAARAPDRPRVLASVVRWKDSSLHPMNRPWLRLNPRGRFAEAAAAGLAPIRTATWVSILVRAEVASQHELPRRHYFIWLDDMEYTGRLLRDGDGYMVPESVAVHWTERPYDTLTDARDRFYFKARNHIWLLRGSSFGGLERARYGLSLVRAIGTYLSESADRSEALKTIGRGVLDGLRREPK